MQLWYWLSCNKNCQKPMFNTDQCYWEYLLEHKGNSIAGRNSIYLENEGTWGRGFCAMQWCGGSHLAHGIPQFAPNQGFCIGAYVSLAHDTLKMVSTAGRSLISHMVCSGHVQRRGYFAIMTYMLLTPGWVGDGWNNLQWQTDANQMMRRLIWGYLSLSCLIVFLTDISLITNYIGHIFISLLVISAS